MNELLIIAPTYPSIDHLVENKIGFNNRVQNKPGTYFSQKNNIILYLYTEQYSPPFISILQFTTTTITYVSMQDYFSKGTHEKKCTWASSLQPGAIGLYFMFIDNISETFQIWHNQMHLTLSDQVGHHFLPSKLGHLTAQIRTRQGGF